MMDTPGGAGDKEAAWTRFSAVSRPPSCARRATLGQQLVARLVEHFTARATRDNNSSPNLSHTEMLKPSDSPLFAKAADADHAQAGRLRRAPVRRAHALGAEGDVGQRAGHGRASGHAQPRQQLHLRRRVPDAHAPGLADGVHEVARRHRLHVQERPHGDDARASSARTSGSARRRSPATWCCSRAT